jgi:DNA-binding MurR/RpiR family transcriptional regulator
MMKNVRVRLKEYHKQSNGAEQNLIQYMLDHPEKVAKMSVQTLAEQTYTSAATVIRLCQKLGFSGYKEMISCLNYENGLYVEQKKSMSTHIDQEDNLQDIVDKVTYRSILALEDTKKLMNLQELEACVGLLSKAEKIGVFGIGATLLPAMDLYAKFLMLGKLCMCNADLHTQMVYGKNLTEKDAAVVFCYSGTSEEMYQYVKLLKERKVPIILINRFGDSDFTLLADHVLYFSSKELQEGTTDTASRISQMNLVDILISAYVAADPALDLSWTQ